MAEYGYNGGSTERSRRPGARFPVRDYTYDNYGSEWSKPGYGAKDDTYRDHVCRPVVVDAEGKVIPGVFILPSQQISDAFVTQSETVVEHVYAPQGYTRSSATKAEILRDYAGPESEWGRKEAYVDPSPGINRYVDMNKKGGLPQGLFQRRAPFPRTSGGSYESGTKEWSNPKYDTVYQPKYEGYHGKDVGSHESGAKEWSNPKYDTVHQPKYEGNHGKDVGSHESGAKEWSNPKYDTVHQPMPEGYHGKNVGSHESGAKEKNNPKYGTMHQPNHDSYHGKEDRRLDDPYSTIPQSTVGNGFNRGDPSIARNYDSPITKPTNDIGALADYIKEPARTTVTATPTNYAKELARTPLVTKAPQGNPSVSPVSPKKPAREKIDSKEAERRYGSLDNPVPKVDKSTAIIDSKRAAQIYNGTFVPL